MPFKKLVYAPGVNTQATKTLNGSGYSASNTIRWLNGGYLEKYGGWQLLTNAFNANGVIRSIHAWEDLSGNKNLIVGSDNAGAQLYVNGSVYSLLRSAFTSAIPGAGSIIPSPGTKVATVTDPDHGHLPGDKAWISVPYALGGTVIWPQVVTIASTTINTWSFNNAVTFTSSASFGVPLFNAQVKGSSIITVQLSGHGLSPGQSFQINWDVVYTATAGIPDAVTQAGTYTVLTVPNSSTFTIDSGVAANKAGAVGYEYSLDGFGKEPISYIAANPTTPKNWFTDNLGQNGLVSYTNSPIYQYIPPVPTGGSVVLQNLENGPQINTGMLVAMPQAQIIAFGSEAIIGGGVQDPLLIRWSSPGDSNTWVASATNQAGSYRLSRGSRVIGAIQAPQSTLIWTDVDLWSMAYIGGQLVYSFLVVGSGCGLISAHAQAVVGRTTYWMGPKSFWTFGDEGVQPLECDVYDQVFNDLNPAKVDQCFAGADSAFHEVIFFYPTLSGESAVSAEFGYVKYNTLSRKWDYGKLERTAWIDAGIFGPPLAAEGFRVWKQDTGFDDGINPMGGVLGRVPPFVETGFAEIGEGEQLMFVDQVIPDFKWQGAPGGYVNMTIWGCNFPGDNPVMYGPYTITPTTPIIPVRLRHRLVAFRWEWGAVKGFNARIGAPMVRYAPAGRQ